ncbi:hypothetical protein [Acetobacter sp.]|uniref:hypothetical protein n=1 Tax=Acetobacter sp. TaxID=440 RepID=UPI00258704AF|nr:hypothetical protein [Acetobacter sp.]MCC6104782.1 hypothetical protein [Acetobacter sp.]
MEYQASLKDLRIRKGDGYFAVKAMIALAPTDPHAFLRKGEQGPTEIRETSYIRVETELQSLPATTEDQWTAWALEFLKDALPKTAIKPASDVR